MRTRILTLIAALTMFMGAAHATPYVLGDTVPTTVQATSASGKTVKIADYRGKIVVLEWNNPGCPFVQKHYNSGNMQKLQADYTAKGIIWLAVNSASKGKQGYFTQADAPAAVAKLGFKGTDYLLDPTGTFGQAFGAATTPHMFVIDSAGKLVYMGAIDSIPSFNKEDIAKATNYVASAIDELLAGKPVTTAQTNPYGCSVKY